MMELDTNCDQQASCSVVCGFALFLGDQVGRHHVSRWLALNPLSRCARYKPGKLETADHQWWPDVAASAQVDDYRAREQEKRDREGSSRTCNPAQWCELRALLHARRFRSA